MATIFDFADFFIDYGEKSKTRMTNMRLNKLLFFAQGIYLAKYGMPLFEDDFEAWPYGPVVCDIYERYKRFEANPIVVANTKSDPDIFSEEEYEALLDTALIYCELQTHRLVKMSHMNGGAWDITKKANETIISKKLIKQEFDSMDIPRLLPLQTETIGFRDANGYLVLPHEDDDDSEWREFDAI